MKYIDLEVLRNARFRLLGLSQLGSVTGEQILTVAITISVLNAGGDVSSVGLVLAIRGLASVFFLLAGGVWADRLPRRRVLMMAYLVAALAASVLVMIPIRPPMWLLAGVIFVAGTADAFIRPAFNASLRSVLTDDQRVSGRALISVCVRAGVIVGPGLGVALLVDGSPRPALGVTVALFALAAVVYWYVQEPPWRPVRGGSMLADIMTGVSEARRRPWLVALLLFSPVSLMFVIAPAQVLLPLVSRDTFGSYTVFGTALACFGAGGLVGSLTAMAWRPRSPGTVAMYSMALYALVPLGLLYAHSSWILFAAYLIAGFGVETYALRWDVALQREIPDHLYGRVTALAWLSSMGLMPFGLALTGPITNLLGTTVVLLLAAGLAVVVPPFLLLVDGMTQFHTVSKVHPRIDFNGE
jgi:MFS family permease